MSGGCSSGSGGAGESYLNRKLFSKLKRIRTEPSSQSLSSITDSTAAAASPAKTRLHSDTEEPLDSGQQPIEQVSGGDQNTEEANQAATQPAAINQDDGQPSSSSSSGNNCQAELVFAAENGHNNHHHHHHSHPHRHDKTSKLKNKSRAVWMFLRAASSLTSSNNPQDSRDSTTHTSTPSSSSAPNTSSSSTTATRVHRFASFASRIHHSNSSNSASASNLNDEANNSHQPAIATCLPRFIVPKMNALNLPIVCLIKSLEGELMREVFVHRYELGQYLLDSLKVSLAIKDCKYFGLKMAKSLDDQEDVRQPWLDLNDSVCKQISKHKLATTTMTTTTTTGTSHVQPTSSTAAAAANGHHQASVKCVCFYLRIKYYPPNLARIQDAFVRKYLWLQLRRDLRLGKLTSSMNNLTLLMAYVLQHELGDYQADLVERLPELNILPNQDLIEEQAIDIWKTRLTSTKKHQVLMQFLRAAIILETYGFDYYPVRDHQRQRAYLLGFNYNGVKTIRNGRIIHHFRWHSLNKISYERRMIIFHIYPTENSKRKQILGFKCLSNDDCQNLYMRLLEQKYFFTVDLTYFDKSVRRPSCLESSQSAVALDWSAIGRSEDQPQHSQHQHQQHLQQQQQPPNNFGSTSNSIADFNTTRGHLNGSFDRDVELDQMNDDEADGEDESGDGDGDDEMNGCDCRDYDETSATNHYQSQTTATSWRPDWTPLQQTVRNTSDKGEIQQQQLQQLPRPRTPAGDQLGAECMASNIGAKQATARPPNVSRNFIKSSSLQERASLNPLSEHYNGSRASSPTNSGALEGGEAAFPPPGRQTPPPAPPNDHTNATTHRRLHERQSQSVVVADEASHAPLQRQHSTLVYLAPDDGHANSTTGPGEWRRDRQIDLLDKNNPSIRRRQQSSADNVDLTVDGPNPSTMTSAPAGQANHHLPDNLVNWLLPQANCPDGQSGQQQQQPQRDSTFALAVRFCIIVLVMNFLLRLTDHLSAGLIDLLTVPGADGSGASSPGGPTGAGGSGNR